MPLSTRITRGGVPVGTNAAFTGKNTTTGTSQIAPSKKVKKTKKDGEEAEEDEKENTLTDFVLFHLDKFFVEHIPVDSVKELSSTYMYYFGLVAYSVMLVYFVYFTYSSYIGAVTQAFIAIDQSSGECQTVQISVSGNYLADNKGNWLGSPAFAYADGVYYVNLNNFLATPAQYSSMMEYYYRVLVNLGEQGKNQSLPYNLARWSSFIRYYAIQDPALTNFSSIGYGQLQYIQLSGDPQTIFNLGFQQLVLGSSKGYCPVTSFTQYDYANGYLYTNLNSTKFVSSYVCSETAIPNALGYSEQLDDEIFQVSMEVRAFMTAFAVNTGILQITSLYRSGGKVYNFEFNNVTYVAGEYFDVRYSDMKPIFCLYNTSIAPAGSFTQLCLYLISSTIAIPVFSHFGTSNEYPSFCSCENGKGRSSQCQLFNIMSSLIYFPVELDLQDTYKTLITQITYIVKLVNMYSSYQELNDASYNATWGAAAIAYGSKKASTTTSSFIRNSFNFCDLKSVTCSVAVFHSTDESSQLVSTYKYQLVNGSCSDSFTIPEADYSKLAENPPVQLTENYYECYEDEFTAFTNALGIASGNTQLAVPFTVIFLLPLVYLILVAIHQAPPKEEYNNREKAQALEILSILLLRLRDGKTRGIKKKGVLIQLTNELIKAAKEESGYPDSDDEAEDSDDERGDDEDNAGEDGKEEFSQPKVVTLDSDDEEEVRESMSAQSPSNGKRKSRKSTRKSTKPAKGRKSSITGTSSTPTRPGVRTKMGVFTKQLEETDPIKKNWKRKSKIDHHVDATESSTPDQSSNLFNYLFSSSKKPNENAEQEMVSIGNPMFLGRAGFDLIDPNHPPPDVQIMNYSDHYPSRKISGEQVPLLVDDLMSLFSQAISLRPSDPMLASKATMSAAIESEAFRQGSELSKQLAQINFTEFVSSDDPTIFFKLSNALSMHASIELRCEMKQLEMLYADRVGYNVGGRLMTAAGLMKLL